jgi:hypothetical protein
MTAKDHQKLLSLERQIEGGIATYIRVGELLQQIKSEKLYLSTHKSWEEYCKERWKWTPNYANRQINAFEYAEEIKKISPSISIPNTEYAARNERSSNEFLYNYSSLPVEKKVAILEANRKTLVENNKKFERPPEEVRRYIRFQKHITKAIKAGEGVSWMSARAKEISSLLEEILKEAKKRGL